MRAAKPSRLARKPTNRLIEMGIASGFDEFAFDPIEYCPDTLHLARDQSACPGNNIPASAHFHKAASPPPGSIFALLSCTSPEPSSRSARY
jgi:hypothetical protein